MKTKEQELDLLGLQEINDSDKIKFTGGHKNFTFAGYRDNPPMVILPLPLIPTLPFEEARL